METAQKRHNDPSTNQYSKLRYKSEAEIEKVLEEDFSMAQYYDIFDNKDDLDAITNEMLSNCVLLNSAIAPRIYTIYSEIQQKLGFDQQIDFYLQSHTEVNAFSINGFGIVPHIISLTSALIQLMTDDELRFVIGHEIGHLIYQHSKLNIVHRFLNKREDERLPAMIILHYLRYINYAEISADRIGYIAMPDINVVTSTFFKLTCGLSEQHLNFITSEYLKQLDRIKDIGAGDLYSSHPNPMIRIQALMHFAVSELSPFGVDASMAAAELDERVNELMQLLEKHPKKQKDLMIVQFLATLGMYMATYDEDSFQQKYNQLFDWISDYSTQPEAYLVYNSPKESASKIKQICHYYAQQQDNDKFLLLEYIVLITMMDGRLEPEEKRRLNELADLLNISSDALNLTIRRCSENYLAPNKKVLMKEMR